MLTSLCALALAALPFTSTIDRLDNGLTVVTVPTAAEGIVAYYTVVRVGARDEVEAGRTGFAHFFEHMMFRGTERFSSHQWSAVMQGHGADTNAYTTADYTAYYAVAPKAALADLVDLEADRFRHLKYAEADFKTEAGAVLGEYNKSYSNPGMKLWEGLASTAFAKHTYGHTVIGYLDDVKAMPEGFDYSRSFFERFYTPDNTTLLVVGDVDRAELMTLVSAKYGGWAGKHHAPEVPVEPAQTAPRQRHFTWDAPTPARLTVAWKVPGYTTKSVDTAALDVAGQLLFGETSPLFRALVLDERKVLSLEESSGWHRRDAHLYLVEAKHSDAGIRDALVTRIQGAVDALAKGPIDAKRLVDVKSHLRYGRLMRMETVGQIAGYLVGIIGLTGDVGDAERYFERLAAVTASDVQRVAREQLTANRRSVVSIAHEESAK